jgi:hypothetical protein
MMHAAFRRTGEAPGLGALPTAELENLAYKAVERGALARASLYFGELLQRYPDLAHFHYMQGLIQKYQRNWWSCLRHNLLSQSLSKSFDEACAWNAGIAATAIRDWTEARRQWARCAIDLPDGDGPIAADLGVVGIRLNAWADSETLFAERLDPVRARLANIPLPESGHRLGDIVLHDGAPAGELRLGGGTVPIFNALERWQPSLSKTFTARVSCPDPADLVPLLASKAPGIIDIEDWTASVVFVCSDRNADVPRADDVRPHEREWQPQRQIGIAARSFRAVEAALAGWQARSRSGCVEAVDCREFPEPVPGDGQVWWRRRTALSPR